MVQSFRDLVVWQRSFALVKEIYKLTNTFPQTERYGLASQMQRAAVSIPPNIAEGHVRPTRRDYAHFVSTARGSAAELEAQLLLSAELDFATTKDIEPLLAEVTEIQKMLSGLRRKLIAPPLTPDT